MQQKQKNHRDDVRRNKNKISILSICNTVTRRWAQQLLSAFADFFQTFMICFVVYVPPKVSVCWKVYVVLKKISELFSVTLYLSLYGVYII